MEHVDEQDLALIALGEPTTDDQRGHLAACDRCRQEVDALRLVVVSARSVTAADVLVPAPAEVWSRIEAELGLGGATAVPPAPAPAPAPAVAVAPDGAPSAQVVQLRPRRTIWIAAAAAAGVVVGGAGGALLARTGPDPDQPSVLAETVLEPLPGWSATGQAEVQELPDGQRVLVVTVADGQDTGGFNEVWLIDREVSRLVSLGVLEGSEGTFTVPAGLDLAEFPVVDVSEEPYDGDPAHSGDSIIRGILDA